MMGGVLNSCPLPPLGAGSPQPEYRCGGEFSPPQENCEAAMTAVGCPIGTRLPLRSASPGHV